MLREPHLLFPLVGHGDNGHSSYLPASLVLSNGVNWIPPCSPNLPWCVPSWQTLQFFHIPSVETNGEPVIINFQFYSQELWNGLSDNMLRCHCSLLLGFRILWPRESQGHLCIWFSFIFSLFLCCFLFDSDLPNIKLRALSVRADVNPKTNQRYFSDYFNPERRRALGHKAGPFILANN